MSHITLHDIAKKLKITAATVSRALNNHPCISEHTKQKVLKVATALNYKQNKIAQALRKGKSFNVGVIVPRVDSNLFASIIRGIEDVLTPTGYHVIICQTHEDKQQELDIINTLINAQVDGLFISVSNPSFQINQLIQGIIKQKIPFIFFDRTINIEGTISVTLDDFKGGYLATKSLIEQGCSKIAHICGDKSLEIYKNRFEGYHKALKERGINFSTEYIFEGKSKIETGKEAVKYFLNLPKPPDAIFSASDFAALGAMQELKKMGIKVPKDFCVFGFGNEPFTDFMELPISSVHQSPLEMGREVANAFINQINALIKKKEITEKKILLEPLLYIRKSSCRKQIQNTSV